MSWSSQLIDIGRSADSTWTEFIAADESASLSFCSLLRPRRKLCRVVSSRPRSRPTRSTCLDFKVSKSYNMTERKLPVSSRPGYFCGLHDVHAIGPPATQQRRAPKVIGKSGYGLATVNEATFLFADAPNGAAAVTGAAAKNREAGRVLLRKVLRSGLQRKQRMSPSAQVRLHGNQRNPGPPSLRGVRTPLPITDQASACSSRLGRRYTQVKKSPFHNERTLLRKLPGFF